MDSVKATISKDYRRRLALVGAMVLFFSLWFAYDAAIGYPTKRERYQVWEKLVRDDLNREAWRDYAIEQGFWSASNTGHPPDPSVKDNKSEMDIVIQWVCAGATFPVAVLFLTFWLTASRRWVMLDGTKLSNSAGKQTSIDQIKSIDATRWRSKGIAVVHFEAGDRPEKIVLDDWKFERKPTVQIYRALIEHITPETGSDPTPATPSQGSAPAQDSADPSLPAPDAANPPSE